MSHHMHNLNRHHCACDISYHVRHDVFVINEDIKIKKMLISIVVLVKISLYESYLIKMTKKLVKGLLKGIKNCQK